MTSYVISSGVQSGYVLRPGDSLTVLSGGVSFGSILARDAYEAVLAGGASDGDVLRSGGIETVASGALVSGARVSSGAELDVNGTAQAVTVSSGGFVDLSLVISSGQSVDVPEIGNAMVTVGGVTAEPGAELKVDFVQVAAGATLTLASGAIAGEVDVARGGVVNGPGILSGGNDDAGLVSGCVLGAQDLVTRGLLTVSAGGVAEAVTVIESLIEVKSGGYVSQIDLGPGSTIDISSGGTASNLTLVGGSANVYGRTQSTTLSGADVFIWRGGVATATSVLDGGVEYVEIGGVASATTVASGGVEVLTAGGAARGDVVEAGGTLDIGVISSGLNLSLSDQPFTQSTSLYGVTLQSGSYLSLGALGGLQVKSGATLFIPDTASFHGALFISAGATVSGSGRLFGVDYVTGELSGVTLDTTSGISESYAIVSKGGIADAIRLVSGSLAVRSAGLASRTTLLGDAATLLVARGGVADATVVTHGSVEFDKGGTLSGASIAAGGMVIGDGLLNGLINDAGIVSGVSLASAAHLNISSGGSVEDVMVNAGGQIDVHSGGVGQGGAVAGSVEVLSGGLVMDVSIQSGGAVSIGAGAIVSNCVVSAGGELALGGAAVFDTPGLIDIGGALSGKGVVFYAGDGHLELTGDISAFRGQIVDEAGEIEIGSSDQITASSVQFGSDTRTKTLQLDTSILNGSRTTLTPKLVDFNESNDMLDLHGLTYVAGATATLNGSSLVVKDGASTVVIKLSGDVASAYSVSKDGEDRVRVRAANSSADGMIQAMAGFGGAAGPGHAFNPLLRHEDDHEVASRDGVSTRRGR